MGLAIYGLLAGAVGLGVAAFFAYWVMQQDPGSERMVEISRAVQDGAMAFLGPEYRAIAIFLVVVAALILFWLDQPYTAGAYIVGAVFSGTAGFVGLSIATRANSRTTQ